MLIDPSGWKGQAISAVRQLLVALVTAGIILAVLIIGFAGQTATERQVQQDTLYANLAIACELALPVDPDTGRDEADVMQCFTQYGLQAPRLHG